MGETSYCYAGQTAALIGCHRHMAIRELFISCLDAVVCCVVSSSSCMATLVAFHFRIGSAEYCDERVCLSPRSYLRNYTSDLHEFFFLHVTYGCGLVPVWRRSDTLCTSGFMDKSYLLISRPAVVQCTRSPGLGCKMRAVIPVAGQLTHGTTLWALKVTVRVATPGAESAVYDYLVLVAVSVHICM